MDCAGLLEDAFGRVHEAVHEAVEGLDEEALAAAPGPGANPIAWLVWHLTRIQDDHVADAAGREQLWTAQGWANRLDLPLPHTDTGYGHTPDRVAAVRAGARELLGYHDAVHTATLEYVRTLGPGDLDRVVDASWTPAVTLGVRLVSVVADDLQHAGQAAYARGLLERGTRT
ncbi:mycothiol transferase [Streptomyces sanyensis]|uniref:mycothiol transferase n=1 Tax=Streptomyces sanyensis TaxID=568869 RepID=UPI003D770604